MSLILLCTRIKSKKSRQHAALTRLRGTIRCALASPKDRHLLPARAFGHCELKIKNDLSCLVSACSRERESLARKKSQLLLFHPGQLRVIVWLLAFAVSSICTVRHRADFEAQRACGSSIAVQRWIGVLRIGRRKQRVRLSRRCGHFCRNTAIRDDE